MIGFGVHLGTPLCRGQCAADKERVIFLYLAKSLLTLGMPKFYWTNRARNCFHIPKCVPPVRTVFRLRL
jgi:hypothetical protein